MTLVALAAIAHAFEEYCEGRGGESADFAASAASYVFALHLAMGVRLVGSVLSWFGAGGGRPGGVPRGWGRGTTAREATIVMVGAVAVVRTTAGVMAQHCWPFPRSLVHRRVGGGADDGASALLAIPRSLV